MKNIGVILLLLGMTAFCFEMDERIQEKKELEENSMVEEIQE